MRGHDGHHQHRRAVTGDAADAVLVDHHALVPVQALTDFRHRLGEEVDLLAIELALVGGDDKGGELDLRVAAFGDVTHDGAKILARQALAGNLAMQGGNGAGRLGLRYLRRMTVPHAKLGKRIHAQTDLVAAHDARVIDHVQGRQHLAPIGAHFHLGQGLETFGAIDGTVAMQIGDVLAIGIDRHPT